MNQFSIFVLVGVANTALGYSVIFGCLYLAGMSPEFSNIIGYLIGLVASYFLHRNYTFRSKRQPKTEFFNFVVVFLIAYVANLATLIILVRALEAHAGFSQIIAGAVYVATSYLLNRNYVFRPYRAN